MSVFHFVHISDINYFEYSNNLVKCDLSIFIQPEDEAHGVSIRQQFSVPFPYDKYEIKKDELIDRLTETATSVIDGFVEDEGVDYFEVDYDSCWSAIEKAYDRSLKTSLISILNH